MNTNKEEIIILRKKGWSIRKIQNYLGISTPSLVHYHIRKNKQIIDWMTKTFVFPERLPLEKGGEKSLYMNTGYNAYRDEVITKISELKDNNV